MKTTSTPYRVKRFTNDAALERWLSEQTTEGYVLKQVIPFRNNATMAVVGFDPAYAARVNRVRTVTMADKPTEKEEQA